MRIPWPTPLHEQLRHSSTRAERERFQSLVETISFRKSDVHIARGELSVMIRRQAARRFIGLLGIPLMELPGAMEPRVVPSKLTIRSVHSSRIEHDEHPGDEIDIGALSLYQVDKGLLYLGERHEAGERYDIEIHIDSLDVELADIA
jgi:hypothetical protein